MTDKIKKPKFTQKVDYRPKGVKETGFVFVGHEISEDGTRINQKLHYDQLYVIRHGSNSKVFLGFLEGKIYGTKCPRCGDKFFPPRINCWNLDCELKETEWIELKPEAYVHTYTVAGWSGRSSLTRLPLVLVYGVVDGCKVAVANELHGIDPWDCEFNMPLKITFKSKEERVGATSDWYFEPADDWKPSPMNPEKERIKNLVKPVYEWVESLKMKNKV
ncbi:MAG: Zn-ribbon domain-containing OB-fold protein [Candidatus Hodarchaeales archaeon]